MLTIFIGVMFGVQAANKIINQLAIAAAFRANKVIALKPLTKGIIYPIVKRIALAITGNMIKRIFASGVSKIIPVVGAVTSGGLTFVTFKPIALRLKKHLETLPIADVNFYKEQKKFIDEDIYIDHIQLEDNDFEVDDHLLI